MAMRLSALLRNRVLARELEVRASRDEGYRVFDYSGPGLFLLLGMAPVACGLFTLLTGGPVVAEPLSRPMFLVTSWLLTAYFSYAASRACAGSMAIEAERGTLDALRLMPHPANEVLVGKYVAGVAPLLVEALATAPLLGLYALLGDAAIVAVGMMVTLFIGLVLSFGMLGTLWSITSPDVPTALSRSASTVATVHLLPLVTAVAVRLNLGAFMDVLLLMSPLGLATRFAQHAPIPLGYTAHDLAVVAALGLAVVGASVLAYRVGVRRLTRS